MEKWRKKKEMHTLLKNAPEDVLFLFLCLKKHSGDLHTKRKLINRKQVRLKKKSTAPSSYYMF